MRDIMKDMDCNPVYNPVERFNDVELKRNVELFNKEKLVPAEVHVYNTGLEIVVVAKMSKDGGFMNKINELVEEFYTSGNMMVFDIDDEEIVINIFTMFQGFMKGYSVPKLVFGDSELPDKVMVEYLDENGKIAENEFDLYIGDKLLCVELEDGYHEISFNKVSGKFYMYPEATKMENVTCVKFDKLVEIAFNDFHKMIVDGDKLIIINEMVKSGSCMETLSEIFGEIEVDEEMCIIPNYKEILHDDLLHKAVERKLQLISDQLDGELVGYRDVKDKEEVVVFDYNKVHRVTKQMYRLKNRNFDKVYAEVDGLFYEVKRTNYPGCNFTIGMVSVSGEFVEITKVQKVVLELV